MSKYSKTDQGVINTKTNEFIPNDPGSKLWAEYQEWSLVNDIPKQPTPNHIFDDKTKSWVIDWNYVQFHLLNEIDMVAEQAREEVTTSYPLLSTIYNRKLIQAEKFKNQGYQPVNGNGFPYMVAERDAMRVIDPGATTKDAADRIIEISRVYDNKMSKIESERRIGKEKVVKFKGNINKMNKTAKNTVRQIISIKDKF